MARQLQLHQDHVDQGRHRGAPGFDHKMRRIAVQRITGLVQRTQTGQRIVDLQQESRLDDGAVFDVRSTLDRAGKPAGIELWRL